MTAPDVIDLEVGSSPWLQASPWMVGTLGLAAMLTSAAAVAWKLLLLCGLGVTCAACVRGGRRKNAVTGLRLHADGGAILFTETGTMAGTLADSGWCSRWCCVVAFVDAISGRSHRCLLCRSRNSADAYRRLLVRLRMGGVTDTAHGAAA